MCRWLEARFPRHRRLWRQVASGVPDDDLSHDRDHLARVYRWALRLAREAGADPDLAGAAALLHDLVSVPKEDAGRREAGERSAASALQPLLDAGYAQAQARDVMEAVRTSSWSSGLEPTGPLGRVLQDADRLDAIGAIGIARTLCCAQGMVHRGRPLRLYHDTDLRALRREPQESRYAVDHFHTKLLKLAAGMHLPAAQEEAARRQRRMIRFLGELAIEVGQQPDEQPPDAV